jgi:hypothetical protein
MLAATWRVCSAAKLTSQCGGHNRNDDWAGQDVCHYTGSGDVLQVTGLLANVADVELSRARMSVLGNGERLVNHTLPALQHISEKPDATDHCL